MNFNFFFSINHDKRGSLISIELEKFKLFKIKRFFIIDFKNKSVRGNHAHKKCKQFFICLKGKIKVHLLSKTQQFNTILNKDLKKGLYVEQKTWNTLEPVSKDCQILCLCDMQYSKNDYINDFEKFKKIYKI